MREDERLNLLLFVVRKLNDAGSWTGRTHIHKLIYFAQSVLKLSSGYQFVLYQRGPYSFELDRDVRMLRSVEAIEAVPAAPYGPTYIATESVELTRAESQFAEWLKDLAEALGPKTASELELLATTLWAIKEENLAINEGIVERVLALKPHFREEQVSNALSEVRVLLARFPATN